MSSNQNIPSSHRSPNRERDGCVLTMTSLQKEKPDRFPIRSFHILHPTTGEHTVAYPLHEISPQRMVIRAHWTVSETGTNLW